MENKSLNENSSKKEIELRFRNAKHVMDDLMEAYYGLTFEEIVRLIGKKEQKEEQHSEEEKE